MKHLIGKKVWLSPTGNNQLRSNPYEIKTGTVTNVARVKLDIMLDSFQWAQKINFYEGKYGLILDSGCNSGYILFETEDAINEYYFRIRISKKLHAQFTFPKNWEDLSIHQLKQITEIVGIE